MRMFKRVAIVATMAGLVVGPVAAASSASASTASSSSQVRLTGGETTVTTAPGIATALLGNGIVPVATLPGTEGASIGSGGVAVKFTFPVTGGWLNAKKLTGTIWHKGGILFADVPAGKQILVSDFVISVHQGVLTAEVNGSSKVRVPLLKLSLAHAAIHKGWHSIKISGIGLTLTSTAASALDATFGTGLFTAGMTLGTASTVLRF
ncbi:MAG TPA: hypothetical protein VGI96_08415 [Streptosporangiaceae bacterium]|jgi:hypothetical protein